ncbi:MAG: NAD(P)-binding domain-containing protein [Chloroflexota bacterium]
MDRGERGAAMIVGILGTGHMGKGIARAAVRGGHEVVLGSRERARAEEVARSLGASGVAGRLRAGTYEEAAVAGEIVVVGTPYSMAAEILGELRDHLAGKVVVDITNPLGMVDGRLGLTSPAGSSGLQENQKAVGSAVTLTGAFRPNFAATFDDPTIGGQPADVWIFGADPAAKERVAALARDMGFAPVDLGGPEVAHTVEGMVVILIGINGRDGLNWRAAFNLVHD